MLASADLTAPISFSADDNWEITAAVDPFGRPERQVASDGGLVLSGYRGDTWSQTLVLDPDLGVDGGLSRTITRRDARGQTLESWEDKGAPAIDPLHFLNVSQMVPWRFVRGNYEYDVGGRTTEVEIRGQDINSVGRVQRRTMTFNALGELLAHSFPEHGAGNGTIAYENFDAFGTPRRTVLAESPLEAIETKADAAGREIERWMLYGSNRYLVGSVRYGADAAAHEVGKVATETRYNLVASGFESCPGGCIETNAIGVTHSYAYADAQGLLSGRTTEISFGGHSATGGVQAFSLGYEYDRWGNLDRVFYPELAGVAGCTPSAPTIDLVWDPVALASITDATTGVALFSEPHFDPATGMLVDWKTAAGTSDGAGATPGHVNHQITVDGTRARPHRIKAVDPSNPSPALFDTGSYSYDAAGNILSIGTWDYAYDDLGRLTSADHPSYGARGYTYDDFGNLAELGGRTIPVSWSTNRLTSATYDRRGNLTTETMPDGWTRRLRFDLDNQLVAVWATGPSAPDDRFGFAYDLSGERVLKYRVTDGSVIEATFSLRDQEGNVLTDFLWTPSTVGNTAGNWHRLSDHVFLGRRPLVHRTSPTSGQITYTTVVTDHLQSTRKEISNLDNPAAQSTFTYWPFGEFAERLGTPAAKHLYTAHEREDTGTTAGTMAGLDYMHARFFGQQSGKFLSDDPISSGKTGASQSWNMTTYTYGNPVGFIDPDGRAVETPWDVINVTMGATSLVANIASGNVGGAVLDFGGLVVDLGATVVPGLPGGASTLIKASRAARAARVAANAKRGLAFERQVLTALRATKGRNAVTTVSSRVTTIPDLPIGKLFGVTDIKDVKQASLTKQLRAQLVAAQTGGKPFSLIISTRTDTISRPLSEAIRRTNGKIFIFDSNTEKFVEAVLEGNKVIN